MFNDIEAIIFDMDGTLIDSMWVWRSVDIDFFEAHGMDVPTDYQENIEGKSFYEVALYTKECFDIPLSIEEIMNTWNDMAIYKYGHEVKLKKGARELIDKALKKGIKLAIATSNSRELALAALDNNNITDCFEYILTANEVKKGKPEPDVYLAVAEHLNVKPTNCLVFEDTMAGITAGKRANMRVCAIEDEHSLVPRCDKAAVSDYYIDDYTEVYDRL